MMGLQFDGVYIFQPNEHSNCEIRWESVSLADREYLVPWSVVKNFYPYCKAYEVSRPVSSGMKAQVFRVVLYCSDVENIIVALFRKGGGNWIPEQYLDDVPDVPYMLHKAGIKTPSPVEGRNEYFTYWHEKGYWHVYPFLEGSYFTGSNLQLAAAAQEVAKMHKILGEKGNWRSDDLTPASEYFDMKFLEARLDKINEIPGEAGDFIRNAATTVRTSGCKLTEQFVNIMSKKQTIHGDLHPHNLIFVDHVLVGIIDFGNSRVSLLPADVAMACHRLVRQGIARESWSVQTPEDTKQQVILSLCDFVRAYAKEYGPDAKLLFSQLYPFMHASLLFKIVGSISHYTRGSYSPEKAQREIRKFLMLLAEVKYFESVVPDLSMLID